MSAADTSNGSFDLNSLLSDAGSLVKSGVGVYNTVTGSNGKTTTGSGAPAAPSPAASSTSSFSKFLPWIAGGAVIVIVAVLFMFRRK